MFGWFIGSIDYSQAYLNADLDEICYMRAPEYLREYDPIDGVEFIWELHKAIYGHPRSGRLWARCLQDKLESLGFTQFQTDQCVYSKWENDPGAIVPRFCFLCIHTDDVIILSNDQKHMEFTKKLLLEAFEGSDQGALTSFCGVKIDVKDSGVSLSMSYYWDKVLKKFGIKPTDVESSPIIAKVNRADCPEKPDPKLKTSFLGIVGSIMFGFTHCRLDLAYACGCLTRVMHAPSSEHYKQAEHLLRYINATKNWSLNYWRDPNLQYFSDFTFYGFVDAAYADCESTSGSTGGWFFFLGPGQGAISAKSGMSDDVALSAAESETIWASKRSLLYKGPTFSNLSGK